MKKVARRLKNGERRWNAENMIVYSHTSIIPKTLHTVIRVLPGDGRILVKVGQEVEPHDIVGEGKKQSGFRSFSLPELLKITPQQAKKCLIKVVGSQVYQGEVLAKVEKLWGLKKLEFHAPQEGILRGFNEETGVLTFEYPPKFVRVPAGVSGKVFEIVPKKEVRIESVVAKIHGRLGSGKMREGALSVLGEPDIPLQPEQINGSLSGKILVGGSFASKEVLYKALAVRCQGVIVGSINWRHFWEVTGQRGGVEDVGFTLLVTEGFGGLQMEKEVYGFLKENEGRYCILDGAEKDAIVPLAQTELLAEKGKRGIKGIKKEERKEDRFGVLEESLRVRILVPPYMHKFGKIVEISEEESELTSEIFVKTCKVQIGDEVVEVPVRNVEIIRA